MLVVDDEPLIGRVLGRLLHSDHDVFVLSDAREALQRIAAGESYDVVFCDPMMPGMSGVDFYEALCASHPLVARSVVFISGGTFTARTEEFLRSTTNLTDEAAGVGCRHLGPRSAGVHMAETDVIGHDEWVAEKVSPTLRVLHEIRDELREHRGILHQHGTRLEAIEHRQAASEIHLATGLVAVAKAVGEVRDLLREWLDDRDRIDAIEQRLAKLEQRQAQRSLRDLVPERGRETNHRRAVDEPSEFRATLENVLEKYGMGAMDLIFNEGMAKGRVDARLISAIMPLVAPPYDALQRSHSKRSPIAPTPRGPESSGCRASPVFPRTAHVALLAAA